MLNKKMSRTDYIVEVILQTIGIVICIVILYPILNMVAISLSSTTSVERGSVGIIPIGFNLGAYREILKSEKLIRAFMVSVCLSGASALTNTIAVFWTAYPLACCKFPGKKIWNMFVMLHMWFGAGLIPNYLCMSELGLVGTYWPLILGGMISAYNVLITASYIRGIPIDLIESARIDGAKELTVMWRIIAPMSKPVLATIVMWTIAGTWNSYMSPAIYLTKPEQFTLQQVLRAIVLEAQMAAADVSLGDTLDITPDQIRHAVLVVSMIPMLVIYPFLQKFFVKGVTLGAVKG